MRERSLFRSVATVLSSGQEETGEIYPRMIERRRQGDFSRGQVVHKRRLFLGYRREHGTHVERRPRTSLRHEGFVGVKKESEEFWWMMDPHKRWVYLRGEPGGVREVLLLSRTELEMSSDQNLEYKLERRISGRKIRSNGLVLGT